MHSSIIQFSDKPIAKEDYIEPRDLYEDHLVNYVCDYVGDPIDKDDRVRFLKALTYLLKSFADVDMEKGIIKRKSDVTLDMLIEDVKKDISTHLSQHANYMHLFLMRERATWFYGCPFMFYNGVFCVTSMSFVESLVCGDLGDTLYIGEMLDYHY